MGKGEVSQLDLSFGQAYFENKQLDLEATVGSLAHAISSVQNAFPTVCVPIKLPFAFKTLFWSSVHSKGIPDLSKQNNLSVLCPPPMGYVGLL